MPPKLAGATFGRIVHSLSARDNPKAGASFLGCAANYILGDSTCREQIGSSVAQEGEANVKLYFICRKSKAVDYFGQGAPILQPSAIGQTAECAIWLW